MSEVAARIDRPEETTRRVLLSLPELLRVSRVGPIVSHLWLYLLPAMHGGFRDSWNFWVGAVYVTLPFGLLIYGWNDFFDWDVDHISRRKNHRVTGKVFGSSLKPDRLAALPFLILAAQLPFAILWAVTGHVWLVGWMVLMVVGNGLYNGPGLRLSRVPVAAELIATGIYLLIAWLGILIHSPAMPWWSWLFAALTILNLQIMGTLVDVEDDARVGKRTLSVAFGATTSDVAIYASLLIKAALTYRYTGSLTATGVVLAGVLLMAARFSLPRWRPSSTAYSSFLVLDWIWLALLFLR